MDEAEEVVYEEEPISNERLTRIYEDIAISEEDEIAIDDECVGEDCDFPILPVYEEPSIEAESTSSALRNITCANGSLYECSSETQGCYDGSPDFCAEQETYEDVLITLQDSATPPAGTIWATVVLTADHNSGVSGTVHFEQKPGEPTKITADITGLSEGQHGFHIHTYGDFSDGCGASTGGHYNPGGQSSHGAPNFHNRHVGDLGNIEANDEGDATYSHSDRLVNLSGAASVIGRSIVIHEERDDLSSKSE